MPSPGKYHPLEEYLGRESATECRMTFTEIESLLAARLPRSAYQYREWWANEADGHRHVQCTAWRRAGWFVGTVDMEGACVTFIREKR